LGVTEGGYRYRAFISYRHSELDRKWARWLIEKLETFRTPSALVKSGAPARIGQIFRDDDEIPASAGLSQQIEAALRASQFLIVVCSPETPKSRWVGHEIAFFRSLGRGDRILALLIDGTPEESFPKELVRFERERALPDGTSTVEWIDEEPLAADVRPRSDEPRRVTERRAFMRIASALLDVGYDALVQREKQRVVRRQRLQGAMAAALALAIAAGGYEYWDYNTLHTRYYRDRGTRWGVPVGIGEISADTATHRNISYAVDTLHGRVIAMRRENGSHGLMPLAGDGIDGESFEAGVAQWRLPYPADHAVQVDVYGKHKDILHSSAGIKLRSENFAWQGDGSAVVAFKSPAGGAEALEAADSGLVGSATTEVIARTSLIAVHRYVFTPEGYIAKRLYQTVWGAVARDANGSFGESYAYNADGQMVARSDLDARGSVLVDGRRIARLRFSYGTTGEFSAVAWKDIDDKFAPNIHGYALRRIDSDTFGNRIQDSFFDAGGRPVSSKDWGVARVTRRYDDRGNKIEEDYFGTDGRPVLRTDRGMARTTLKFDHRGNDIEENYFGIDARPVLRKDYGIARLTIRYDSNDNDIEERNFGVDGKPILVKDLGFAREVIGYDAQGHLVEVAFFGTDGKPVLRRDYGFARQIWKYDDGGKETEEDYFDTRGNPVATTDNGAARITIRYAASGTEMEDNYYGIDGKPVLTTDTGCARKRLKYDDRGNEIEEAYFGTNGEPVRRRDVGVARVTAQYDDGGRKIEEDYFDADGSPILHKIEGAARVRYDYNEQGDLTGTTRYDVHGQPLSGRISGRQG
jgi:YD repeat-containing protein